MDITLSSDQELALKKITDWLREVQRRRENNEKFADIQYMTFGGFAGTGKTTIISVLLSRLDDIIETKDNDFKYTQAMALTGRAALNMRKAMDERNVRVPHMEFSTIHRFLYKPVIEEGRVTSWEYDPIYTGSKLRLVIIDEASMITRELFNDLRELRCPILFVGDHGQLPPISGNLNLMQNPEVKLETIHRQAQDSPIIRLSMMAREGRTIPIKDYSDIVKKIRSVEEVEHLVKNQDDFAFIVATNKARVKLNRSALTFMNLNQHEPQINSRVICLKNNYNTEPFLFNGQLGNICDIDRNGVDYEVSIKMEGNGHFNGIINGETFNTVKPDINDPMFHRNLPLFDFGYAMTCHKAQGSQFDRVFVFGSGFGTFDIRKRWLYTAITRAQNELYICGDRV